MPYCTRFGQSAALAREIPKEKNSCKVELFWQSAELLLEDHIVCQLVCHIRYLIDPYLDTLDSRQIILNNKLF